MSSYVKEEITDNFEGAAFVALDVDDYDDVHCPSRDLDGTNEENMPHVVMFNGKWEDRAKINALSVHNHNLLMSSWDVPTDTTDFASCGS